MIALLAAPAGAASPARALQRDAGAIELQHGGKVLRLDMTAQSDGWSLRLLAREAGGWNEVIAWDSTAEDGRRVRTYRVGRDEVRVASSDGGLDVTVNGVPARLDPQATECLRAAGTTACLQGKELGAFDRLADPHAFFAAYADLVGAIEAATALPENDPASVPRCTWPCLRCGLALGSYGATFIALLATCPATGGLSCLAGFLSHQVAMDLAFVACAECLTCVDQPPPPPPPPPQPDPDCPCAGEPLCDCD
ncbi:MAG TPA: hypothetical protein VJS92_13820 [Candidatus Polarisedimenticolaceae bacterium]|nr:hypothetical protein [Candidatus Polarisedimenticolaceae bacterium]